MENSPLVPRQRNRRAERQSDAPAQPMASTQQEQRLPQRPVQPNGQSSYQAVYSPQGYAQQPYGQTPRTMYQQQPANPQSCNSPAPRQTAQTQYSPRPRALKPSTPVNSGWQQPTLQEAPRARAAQSLNRDLAREEKTVRREAELQARKQRESADSREKPVRQRLPRWLTWSTVLCFFLVLGLVAAYWLMQAYLVTEENKRIAAWQATLNNYHVTEQADGTLSVTWQTHIEKYASQYNLQPAFVMAIIRNESSFRTNAESSVGARGLMQLMPDTAAWIAGKLDDHSYTFDSMWDAETNIRYGCWYLGYLTRLFHGDAELVSAAYHAGQTTVTQWLSDRTKSADGISLDLDKLSDGPTKQYIGRVTQTYGIYQTLLYPDEAFGAVPAGSDAAPSIQR